jgi:hypothetical protein
MLSSPSYKSVPPSGAQDEEGAVASRRRDAEASAPFLVRAGSAVGLAALASCVGVVPATLRLAPRLGGAGSVVTTWIALAAAVFVPMLLAVIVLRGAWAGLRAFAGPAGPARTFGFIAWTAVVFVALVAFGTVLRATTHHHPLAGATFAVTGVILGGGLALFATRLVRALLPATPSVLRVLNGVIGVVFLAVLGILGNRFVASAPDAPGGIAFDLLACAVAALAASQPALGTRKKVAFATFPLAGPLFILGLAVLRSPAAPSDLVTESAPALAPMVRALSGR